MTGPPALLARKANGVLPVAVPAQGAGVQPNGTRAESGTTTKEAAKPPKAKAGTESEKVIVRRLPPGLTEDELFTILGDTWKPGNGKVGWVSFHAGKVSKDAAKPHRPAFASMNLLHRDDLVAFADTVRTATWVDAKDTWSSSVLVGPPVAEFAVYKKVPSGRRRVDNYQGIIDQDPDFMAFLEALANPGAAAAAAAEASAGAGASSASKDGSGAFQPREGDHVPAIGDDDSAKSKSAVTTTPLIEFLREKKAGKNKDNKASKRQEGARGKGVSGGADDTTSKKRTREKGEKGGQTGHGGQTSSNDRKDREKDRAKDKGRAGERRAKGTTVKILTKRAGSAAASPTVVGTNNNKVAATTAAASASPPAEAIAATNAKAAAAAKENMPKSRRAGIAAAAQILQRDLGLSPSVAHRRARATVAAQEAATAAEVTQTAGGAAPSAALENGKKEDGSNSKAAPANTTSSAPSPAPSTAAAGAKNGGGSGPREERPARGSRGKRGGGVDKGEKEAGKGGNRGATAGPGAATQKAAAPAPAAAAGPVATKILLKKKDDAPRPATAKGESAGGAVKEVKKQQPGSSNGEIRTAKTTTQAPASGSGSGSAPAASSTPSAPTTRAFVKHASPALGVTDALLKQALEAATGGGAGAVTAVEMDHRKGFAFVDFADRASLVRAMAASPVAVAQANVLVMERKETAKKSGGGGGGGNRGGQKTTAAATTAPSDKASVTNDGGSVVGDVKRPRHRGGRRRGGGGGGSGGEAGGEAKGGSGGGRRPPAAAAATAPGSG